MGELWPVLSHPPSSSTKWIINTLRIQPSRIIWTFSKTIWRSNAHGIKVIIQINLKCNRKGGSGRKRGQRKIQSFVSSLRIPVPSRFFWLCFKNPLSLSLWIPLFFSSSLLKRRNYDKINKTVPSFRCRTSYILPNRLRRTPWRKKYQNILPRR